MPIFSYRKLSNSKPSLKITRSQTAEQAVDAIDSKYGDVRDNEKFYHRGKGVWSKYSLPKDRKRTSSLTTDIVKWRKNPQKYDFQGIDTKDAISTVKRVKSSATKPMKLSLSKIEIRKPVGRTTKKNPIPKRSRKERGLRIQLEAQLSNGMWIEVKPDRIDSYIENILAFESYASLGRKPLTTRKQVIDYLKTGKLLRWDYDWYAVVRILMPEKPQKPVEMVKCRCGHTVPKYSVMNASMGSSCPDCYDRMSM